MISGSLGCGLVLLFLVYCAFEDLRAMSVSALAFLAMALSELGWYLARLLRGGGADWRSLLLGSLPGLFLILLSVLTSSAIGMGDGLFFLLIGTAAGLPLTLLLTICTFCLSAVWSLGVIVMRQVRGLPRNSQFIPLLPFTLFPALLWCVQSGVIAGVPA